MRSSKAKVTLIGAGPGDPELLTLAAIKALKSADVILYDALVNPEILEWGMYAQKIFVGKRKGYKRFTQDEINYLLVKYAMQYGHVVRLKGGDPFVFGRGGEELEAVDAFGIDTQIIPGVSSATSASAAVGISLTQRNISEGFWVITGTTKEQGLSQDIQLAARSNSTVVILMGMNKLPQIVELFTNENKASSPIAIIEKAYTSEQKFVIGNIYNIIEQVRENDIKNPAVIVIGDVVKYGQMTKQFFPTINSQNLAL